MTPSPKASQSGSAVTRLRITKKLAPSDRGAITLGKQFGTGLVCVRHRVDPKAKLRYTTVELLVEAVEIEVRQPQLVHVRVDPKEYALHTVVRAAGGRWDWKRGMYILPKRVATVLRLSGRVVKLA
jgi:hypothetical protein